MGNYDLHQPHSNWGEHFFQNWHVQLVKFIWPYLVSTSLPLKVLQPLALAGVTVLLSNLSRALNASSKACTSQYVESVTIILCVSSFCLTVYTFSWPQKTVGILFIDSKVLPVKEYWKKKHVFPFPWPIPCHILLPVEKKMRLASSAHLDFKHHINHTYLI